MRLLFREKRKEIFKIEDRTTFRGLHRLYIVVSQYFFKRDNVKFQKGDNNGVKAQLIFCIKSKSTNESTF